MHRPECCGHQKPTLYHCPRRATYNNLTMILVVKLGNLIGSHTQLTSLSLDSLYKFLVTASQLVPQISEDDHRRWCHSTTFLLSPPVHSFLGMVTGLTQSEVLPAWEVFQGLVIQTDIGNWTVPGSLFRSVGLHKFPQQHKPGRNV